MNFCAESSMSPRMYVTHCVHSIMWPKMMIDRDALAAPLSQPTSRGPSPLPVQETEQTQQVQQPASQSTPSAFCQICLTVLKSILLPCDHFCPCQECFDSLVARSIAKPGPRSEKVRKKLKIECPICRKAALVFKCKPIFNV